MARILGVGIATLDIINSVEHYPCEDEEIRASSQRITRGGNVTNTLTILSQFNHHCYWSGVYCDDYQAKYILEDLEKNHIDYRYSQHLTQGKVPTSYITLNNQTASRTIVHFRDLPELSFEYFKSIPIEKFDWIHFEARAISETAQMMNWLKQSHPQIKVSLEIEKNREHLNQLFGLADIYLFAKNYANSLGFNDARLFLTEQRNNILQGDLICAWGEQGAYASTQQNGFLYQPAFKVNKLVDTLGAGDTFNAAIILAQLANKNWPESLSFACKLAAIKCSQQGFDKLNNRLNNFQ